MLAADTNYCIAQAAERYQVPPALIRAVLAKEGGSLGTVSRNKNGSLDYGPMQINSTWLPSLSKFGISASHLVWDSCVNIGTGTWILATNYRSYSGDWTKAIASYNVGRLNSPGRVRVGTLYAYDVIRKWRTLQGL